jgi:hypothetical protein
MPHWPPIRVRNVAATAIARALTTESRRSPRVTSGAITTVTTRTSTAPAAVARRMVRSMRCRSPGVVETRRAPVACRARDSTLTTMRAPSTDENWPNWSGPSTRAAARVSP